MAPQQATQLDFWRLAEEAKRRGIRILTEHLGGERFATSATDPSRLYRVTAWSCPCRGFVEWQRCTHHACLLAHLGWLPDPDVNPDPAAPLVGSASPADASLSVDCPCCAGSGWDAIHRLGRPTLRVTCPVCAGTGQVEHLAYDASCPAVDDRAA